MKKIIRIFLTITVILNMTTFSATAGAKFTPVTAIDLVKQLSPGITFANTTEARTWPWEGVTPSDSETCWGQPVITQQDIKDVAARGFKSYRICVTWTTHMDKNGKIDVKWLDRIQQITDWCLAEDMYVLINTHHEEELYYLIRDGKYEEAKKHLVSIWSQVAERFKNYSEKLFFEIMNEPNLQSRYGAGDGWIHDTSGNVSRALCDTVNKLNVDALNTIRKSGGYNDKRCVMLCVPGASPDALPYMEVPDDKYVMLGVFGYKSFVNSNTMPKIKEWVNKGVPVVNKEDSPNNNTNDSDSADNAKYAKEHFSELAKLNIPSFYFTGSDSGDTLRLLDRRTSTWYNENIIEAYFAAYGKKPGAIPEKKTTATDMASDIKYTFNNMRFYTKYDLAYSVDKDGALSVNYEGLYKEIKYDLPEILNLANCKSVSINAVSEKGRTAVKFYNADGEQVFVKWNIQNATAKDESYALSADDKKNVIRSIGIMSQDELSYSAKINSITFIAASVSTEKNSTIKISTATAILVPKESTALKLNNATGAVTWSSSNKKVATVSATGEVTGIAKGKATITAKSGGKSYTFEITVNKNRIKRSTSTVSVGKTVVCTLLGETGGREVTWTSADKKIATVDKNGKIKGVKTGKVKITASHGTSKVSFTITVKK